MTKKASPREPIVVDGRHVYVTGDALRTLCNVGALWAHHVHGGGISDKAVNSVAESLRSDLAHHANVALPDLEPQASFDALASHFLEHFDDLDDRQISGCIASIWAELSRLRPLTRNAKGAVESLQTSRGGVPKKSIETVDIDLTGVLGDKQANRTHHGRPWQAVCLWSREVLDAFAAQGNPIDAGCAGENITVSGIDWSLVRPGTTIAIGDVEMQVSAYAIPCKQNSKWFADGDFRAMSHERGWVSRVYALVCRGGSVRVGDTVTLRY